MIVHARLQLFHHYPMTSPSYKEFLFRLADTSLIYGQRLSEWCGHGPALEEDIALANTALDYLGQATLVFKHIATVENENKTEDDYAFLRDVPAFRNLLITELPNGDYAFTIGRQFLFTTWYYLYLQELTKSADEFVKAFAEKSLKEVRYHWQHSSDWTKRLGDGTEESHQRMQQAIDSLWEYTGEFFDMDETDQQMADAGVDTDHAALRTEWKRIVSAILEEATLKVPADGWYHKGSKKGSHTEHLGFILAEMQYLQRTYPGAKW